ncbi:hypothetical protein EVAR_69727_1 [Eumeta japonica]|uniref:Uncharacterized protein n=1 Tax=Eumeta variegata TaxID=151549 RepID=A0A4C1ZZQ2_EUMVA|nr:hypothetical protein EVAR_69727_1 [Eumeta japonica]
MRTATVAPWYIRNLNLHKNPGLLTIAALVKERSKRYFKSAVSHLNPSITVAASYDIKPWRKKPRPKHFFSNADDSITCAIVNSSSPQSNIADPYLLLYRRTCRRRAHALL